MAHDGMGLRDRKREQTRGDLEAAAVALVASNGLENATVEAISERANVSPRTFFNYFESKEDAILGFHADSAEELVPEHAARYADATLVESVVGLLVMAFGPAIADPVLGRQRMAVVKQYPQLLGRQMERMTRINATLVPIVRAMLIARGKATDGPDASAEAEVALMACVAALRTAVKQWKTSPNDLDLGELERRANELVRKTQESFS